MGKKDKWTVAVRPNDGAKPRKITKIIDLKGQGFSVLTPYHMAKSGYLMKLPVDPTQTGEYLVSRASINEEFNASNRVKLTYHTDGFAQFSGENPKTILSGRDPATGSPKGLGLMTHPLATPIWSGGSVGVAAWGLEDFDEADDSDTLFEPKDFYYRNCEPTDDLAYHLSIYVFPYDVVPPRSYRDGQATLQVGVERLSGPLFSVVEMKAIHLEKNRLYLGLMINCHLHGFKSRSGWTMNGPGDFTRDRAGHSLMAVYPRENIPVETARSLDYNPAGR